MGSYKQLMVFTSVFEMYYAMLDGAADVTVFAHGFAVVVFREYLPNSWVPSIVSMALVIAYCVTFGMCMARGRTYVSADIGVLFVSHD
ncbi:hypothetical protein L5515_006551 [Caenorhabditis briggsae]|uniref:Uncharacterized protein n=1 Tax=Caenorhabditis briggsae TaxID=6238 RepID=A0AAE9JL25_CAEBR|nr:hypothetical protein L5515_006551 [Caenorhabditis briggsae]